MTADEQTPEQLRQNIAETREQLGDTAAALGAKSDVKGRAKERFEEIKGNVAGKASEAAGKASEATPQGAGDAAAQARAKVKENPVPPVAVGALVVGFVLGRLSARR